MSRVQAATVGATRAKRIMRFLLVNLFSSLGYSLGAVQTLFTYWLYFAMTGGDLGWQRGLGVAVGLTLANAALLPFLRRARRSRGWPRTLARLYVSVALVSLLLAMAVVASAAIFVPLAALLDLLGVATGAAVFRAGSVPVVGAVAAMLAWGFSIGQATIDHTHLDAPLSDLAEELDGFRLIQISDLHIGNGMEGHRLRGLVERVNGLDPDLIAITGDIFDFDPRFIEEGVRGLAGLRARHGVYAVLGNHDVYTGIEAVAAAFGDEAPGITVLRGDCVRVPTAAPLYIAGIDDPGYGWSNRQLDLPELESLGRAMPGDGPVVLLVHRPEAFPQAARLGFPLVLTGHTHGGQIALPSPQGGLNIARAIYSYHRGAYRVGGSLMYVNRGVGVAGPAIRFNCSREITTIRLAAGPGGGAERPRAGAPARRSRGSA